MPICVLRSPDSIPRTTDEEILDLLHDCEVAGYPQPIIEALPPAQLPRRWWQRQKTATPLYSLYWPLDKWECQIINFGPGITTEVPKQVICAYLFGYLTGRDGHTRNP